jgi:hypothetical protein
MRKLVVAAIVLGGLWLVGEIAAVPFAERQVEQRVAERNRDAATVRADINSFPLVSRVLFTGRVNEADVTLDRVVRSRLTFAEVRFELAGLEVDRAALIRGEARVTAIDRGTITATIDGGALSGLAGRALEAVGADVRISGRALLVGPASFQIPSDLLPCDPEARVDDGRVIVSCTIDEFPETLLEAAQNGGP